MTRARVFFIVILTFTAVAALADSFVVERVEVNTIDRHRAAIIRAESRLVAGRTYTEGDIQQATYRIRRLPFITGADYTLAPGSSTSTRVVQFTFTDQQWLNYIADIQGTVLTRGGGAQAGGGLGFRFFPGGNGVVDLSIGESTLSGGGGGPNTAPFNVGVRYSAYGLFGTSAYAVIAATGRVVTGGKNSTLNPSLLAGVPLGLSQTFRVTYDKHPQESEVPTTATADWILDRADDPYFARHGLTVAVGPEWSKQRFINDFNVGTRFYFHDDYAINRKGLAETALDYRPVAEHSAAWAKVALSRFDESDIHNGAKLPTQHENNAELLIGLAHNFDSGVGGGGFRRTRVEAGGGYWLKDRHSYAVALINGQQQTISFRENDRGFEGYAGVAYRSEWGVIHFSMSYVADTIYR
jgi:hypothetical protein